MMKRIFNCWTPRLICLVVLGSSCENLNGIEKKQPTTLHQGAREKATSVEVVDGHLKFANSESFSQTVRELNQTTDLTNWESHFQGYTSLRRAYKALNIEALANNPKLLEESKAVVKKEVSPDGDSYERTIIDNMLATLVNDKGILQVGDSLHKISDSEVRSTDIQHEAELAKESSTYVRVKKVERRPVTMKPIGSRGARKGGLQDGSYEVSYTADGRSHKFITEAWVLVYFFEGYWSTGVNVSHRRKQTFGWSWSNAFNWNATGNWNISVDSPRDLITAKRIAPPTIYESDEFQPYRYSESGVTGFGVNRYVIGICTWTVTGRDGRPYGWPHYVEASI